MIARVTRYRIRLGKVEEFASRAETLMAAMEKLAGFRVLLLLRGDDPGGRDATSISVWNSAEDLKSSENDTFYYDALSRVMNCRESFSAMHQHEVLKSKFASR